MVTRKTWEEFRASKLLWWTNRLLHTFGWAIVLTMGDDGSITEAYPARVKFRGFCETSEEAGFKGLSEYLKTNIDEIAKETVE